MRFWNLSDETADRGRLYRAVERGLWALAPAVVLVMALSIPMSRATRQQAAADWAKQIASENQQYCAKWGMLVGSPGAVSCLRDLMAIRVQTEGHVLDMAASRF